MRWFFFNNFILVMQIIFLAKFKVKFDDIWIIWKYAFFYSIILLYTWRVKQFAKKTYSTTNIKRRKKYEKNR